MLRWRQAWWPRHSKNEKDAGAVGSLQAGLQRSSHIGLVSHKENS